MTALIIVFLAGLGMIFGSFVNALVWRWHGQDELNEKIGKLQAKKKRTAADDKRLAEMQTELRTLSMSKGRSMCSKCHHPLAVQDLIPLFSWLWLRGRCRYCHQPIEDTPLLEAGLPLFFVGSYLFWPQPFSGYGLVSFIFWLVFLVGFAALTAYDFRWFLLPDKIVWPLAALALIQIVVHIVWFDGGFAALAGAFWGVVVCSGIFYVLHVVSKGEWIGGGDVKLGVVLGLLVGGLFPGALLIFAASLFGTLASLPLLLQRKLQRTSVIPFGPFLMLAGVAVVLFGRQFIDWLGNLVLFG